MCCGRAAGGREEKVFCHARICMQIAMSILLLAAISEKEEGDEESKRRTREPGIPLTKQPTPRASSFSAQPAFSYVIAFPYPLFICLLGRQGKRYPWRGKLVAVAVVSLSINQQTSDYSYTHAIPFHHITRGIDLIHLVTRFKPHRRTSVMAY